MDDQQTNRSRTQRLVRSWAGVATILFLTQLFGAAVPLHGQAPSGMVSDPFEGLQQSLEVAADERLADRSRLSVANAAPRATEGARPRGGDFLFGQQGNFVSGDKSSAERRFQLLGVDAGAIFRELGVPVALLKVVQVESNWKPLALSPKGAFGLWQLMPATARRYGLRVDAAVDERADADKATRAAARYLRDLHGQFGDWALALAAYNAGEDAVEKAMERGKSHDFWSLSERKLLPAETRAYVPVVLASFDPLGTERAIGLGAKWNGKLIRARIVYAAATRRDRVEDPPAIGGR